LNSSVILSLQRPDSIRLYKNLIAVLVVFVTSLLPRIVEPTIRRLKVIRALPVPRIITMRRNKSKNLGHRKRMIRPSSTDV
jgi:hypothetical protein